MPNRIDIGTPTRTQAILNEYGLRAKKKFGQNFLTDGNILSNIVDAAQVHSDDIVIEIGPGIGALTEQLARKARGVLAIEVDPQMVSVLSETMAPYDNVVIVQADVLTVDINRLVGQHFGDVPAVKIVANLPYYITTPILMHLLQAQLNWAKIVVMVQKEVAQRLEASTGSKEYGVLTLMLGYYAQTNLDFIVPAAAFNPSPNVNSAVVTLVPGSQPNQVDHPKQLFALIKACFAHRRKSLWNNLLQKYGKHDHVKDQLSEGLKAAGIDPQIRAERLSLADFVKLYHNLPSA